MPYAQGGSAAIYYEVHGSGEPLLMSAGLGGSGSYWAPQLDALAERFMVILYDHGGTGRSAPATRPCHDVADMANDALAVIDHLDIEAAHFVGHAAGGLIGLELALRHPERVSSLVVVNGWAKADPFLERCFDVRKEILRASGPDAYIRAQPLFLFPPEWISQYSEQFDSDAVAMAAHFPDEEIVLARINAVQGFDARARLADVAVPTLVVSARDDHLVPAYLSAQLAAGIPGATLFEMPWGAHASTVTAAGDFNREVLAFCSGVTV